MKRFIFLLLLLGCLDAYSQKAAIRVNALSAIDGAFGGGISYAIGKGVQSSLPEACDRGNGAKNMSTVTGSCSPNINTGLARSITAFSGEGI